MYLSSFAKLENELQAVVIVIVARAQQVLEIGIIFAFFFKLFGVLTIVATI